LATWVLYVALHIFIADIRGQNIDILEKCIAGFFISIFLPSFMMLANYSVFPRSKYLEDKDSAKPTFKIACSSGIEVPQGFDFNRLKKEIACKWVITFSDDDNHVLKFRTKMNYLGTWGAATWLKLDSGAGKIQMECFQLVVGAGNNPSRKLQNEIELCLKEYKICPSLNFDSLIFESLNL
jgi:hypothetical protein